MNVALRLKFQTDPRCNLVVRKSNEYTKEHQDFLFICLFYTKFIRHYLFLMVADKRETEYENKLTAWYKLRKTIGR